MMQDWFALMMMWVLGFYISVVSITGIASLLN
jgi:hypothetical protein